MTTAIRIALAGVLLVAAGCAAGGAAGGAGPDGMTGDELRERAPSATNLYDAVQQARPAWLRERGGEGQGIVIYMDGVRRGQGVDLLRQISVVEVARIRRLSASAADFQLGSGHPGGAILIETR